MCGITGIFDRSERSEQERLQTVQRMTRTLVHRGPDDEGSYSDAHVALGHRRLSIIDLETGRQPMSNEDGGVWVVLNGEVYNYLELRGLLESKGHRFRTRSDTESIVHAYEEWGTACVERLHGMFAFGVWDRAERRLLLARDRIGKKPLYYAELGDRLAFASEIKALLACPELRRDLDVEALSDYFSLLYIPREKTIFSGVRKLLPGHYMVADPAGVRLHRYWNLEFADDAIGEAEAQEQLASLLDDAVRARLQSDVPVGAFLSGGLDSSTVVALMARHAATPIATTSIGFSDTGYDESVYAREVARHFSAAHEEELLTPSAVDTIQALTWYYDEPFGDSSAIPTYCVSRLARRRVKVALSGDGGDESFAGYRRYYFDRRENAVRSLIPSAIRAPVFGLLGALYPKADYLPQIFRGKAFLSNVARTPWEAYLFSVSGIAEGDKDRILAGDVRAALSGYRTATIFEDLYRAAAVSDPLSRIQYIDFMTYLPDDILTKVDRASMANSLEVRCPLVDHHLVEFAARLPSSLKMRGAESKIILKKAVRGLVPDFVLKRPKMGFAMPVGAWLRTELREMVHEHVLNDRARHGLLASDTVADLWRQHDSGLRDRTTELWGLLVFNLWYERFMSGERAATPPVPVAGSSGSTLVNR